MEPREKNSRLHAPGPIRITIAFLLAPLFVIAAFAVLAFLVQSKQFSASDLMTFVLGIGGITALLLILLLLKTLLPFRKVIKNLSSYIERAQTMSEEYRLAIEGSNEGFWDYDIQAKKIFFSSRWMGIAGYGDQEATKDVPFWQESFHPDDRDGVVRAIVAHLERRTPTYLIEYRLRRASGDYIWVEDAGRALWDASGKPVRMAGVTRDIGNIKRVQEVLESRTAELETAQEKIVAEIRNVEKFKKAADSSTQAVSITDPTGAIIYVNVAWQKLNGYTDTEALGRNPHMLKTEKTDPNIFIELWEKIQAGMSFYSEDIINRRKNGSEYQAAVSIFPIREDNQNHFYVSLVDDVTERKQVDRAKTEFVSLASHQLRTPLSAIRWYSEMLLSKYAGELNEKQQQYIKEIYAGNLRMVELVNALLNVSRIDLGTFAIEPEPTDLSEIADSVLRELTPQVTEKNMKIEKLYDPGIGLYHGDPKLLRIIFQNFLTNSVKYTPPEGTITVEIAGRDGSVYVRVSDTGYGIPKHQQSQIFQKLFRADNVRQKDTEGTGLGMYIVKAIVEESGGKIWFESEENRGTTFHVLLPITGMPKKGGTKGLSA